MTLGRRHFLHTAVASATFGQPAALAASAARQGLLFGSEITVGDIAASPSYARLVARECAILTPGLEAKFGALQPQEGRFEFAPLDRFMAFARAAGCVAHLHTLLWGVGIPAWAVQRLSQGQGRQVLETHIRTVVSRYRGQVLAWDVVNESLDPRWPSGPEGLCTTPWRRFVGPDYVRLALETAHDTDPGALLCLNDDDLEYAGAQVALKREQYIRLIDALLARGAPLHGFGLEAHLKPWLKLDEPGYAWFLRALRDRGLRIFITELDVCDRAFPSDTQIRDGLVADYAARYLALALSEPAIAAVITWGLADQFSSQLREPTARRWDGLSPRPLPYDATLTAKPLRDTLAAALARAPSRLPVRPLPHGIPTRTSPATAPP